MPHENSENLLIDFVRNATRLRWFRSDLTSENISMLQLERAEVEFVRNMQ